MRVLISVLAFIVGLGSIAYSYIGTVFRLASEAGQSASQGNETGAVAMVIDFIMRGEIPQLTGYLYGGALLIVLAVVNLIIAPARPKNEDDPA